MSILEGGENSGRPGYNDRPAKSLWFKSTKHWYGDLDRHYSGAGMEIVNSTGDTVSMSGGEEEEVTDDLYVVDKDRNLCYGAWKKQFRKGISFNKPRPYKSVKTKSDF